MTDMILPKGIVFNKNSVYEEIAKYDLVPTEQILKACHVFSTTSRELYDPTARRLENFWTRVLGGNRRYLSGRVIARLFRDISEEPAFVKLRAPYDRYEPPSPRSQAEQSHSLQPAAYQGPTAHHVSKTDKQAKPAPASSTKVPHPILKKPRGPSSSGPRPTARFASPPGSDVDQDDSKESEVASSAGTAVTHSVDSRASGGSTAREEKKKSSGGTPKKKTASFVASSSSRRKPAMPRRTSSQSASAGTSESGKETSSSAGSRLAGSQGSFATIPERPTTEAPVTRSGKESHARISDKAAGKRPMVQTSTDKTSSKSDAHASKTTERPATYGRANEATPTKTPSDRKGKTPMNKSSTSRTGQSEDTSKRSDIQERPPINTSPSMNRTRSDISLARRSSRDINRGGMAPQNLVSPSTATVSDATAQGTIIEFDENAPAKRVVSDAMREQHDIQEAPQTPPRRTGTSERNAGFTPTKPSTTPTVPLGRSKSQLTLLLERQSEKKPRR